MKRQNTLTLPNREDRQPNEAINKRTHEVPPTIISSSSLSAQRGFNSRGRARGRGSGRGGPGGTGWRGGYRGRGRGGTNAAMTGPQHRHHHNHSAEQIHAPSGQHPTNAGSFYPAAASSSSDRDPSTSLAHTPHRMPQLKPNHSLNRRVQPSKRRQFTPKRPHKVHSDIAAPQSEALVPRLAISPSLFTPPPSPTRNHSPSPVQRSPSPAKEEMPSSSSSDDPYIAPDRVSSPARPSDPEHRSPDPPSLPNRSSSPQPQDSLAHLSANPPNEPIISQRISSPPPTRSPPPPPPPSSQPLPKNYRNVAVQAEQNEAPIVLIPRKRTLLSSPVHDAMPLPEVSSERPPSPKRQRTTTPEQDLDSLELMYPEPDLDICATATYVPDASAPASPVGQLTAAVRPPITSPPSEVANEVPPLKVKEEPCPEAVLQPTTGTLPPPPAPLPVKVKRERSPSPALPEPTRQQITSWTERIELPPDCQKTTPNWQRNRNRFYETKAAKLRKKGLKITKVFYRPDGMVLEWTSPSPVWSDTLEPTSPRATTSAAVTMSNDADVVIIDLTLDVPSLESSSTNRGKLSSASNHSLSERRKKTGSVHQRSSMNGASNTSSAIPPFAPPKAPFPTLQAAAKPFNSHNPPRGKLAPDSSRDHAKVVSSSIVDSERRRLQSSNDRQKKASSEVSSSAIPAKIKPSLPKIDTTTPFSARPSLANFRNIAPQPSSQHRSPASGPSSSSPLLPKPHTPNSSANVQERTSIAYKSSSSQRSFSNVQGPSAFLQHAPNLFKDRRPLHTSTSVVPEPQRSAQSFLDMLRTTAATIHQAGTNGNGNGSHLGSLSASSATVSPAPPPDDPPAKRRKVERVLVESDEDEDDIPLMKRKMKAKAKEVLEKKASLTNRARMVPIPVPASSTNRTRAKALGIDDSSDEDEEGDMPLMKRLKRRQHSVSVAKSSKRSSQAQVRPIASPSAATVNVSGWTALPAVIPTPKTTPTPTPASKPWTPPARSLLPPRKVKSYHPPSDFESESGEEVEVEPIPRARLAPPTPTPKLKPLENTNSDSEEMEEVRKQLILSRSRSGSKLGKVTTTMTTTKGEKEEEAVGSVEGYKSS
ncbi:hypothetical protein V5O48_000273 [Marasmius crinis-equi]|uniref:Uncharacterized protein n=1 Tax=Marasmius crinis-equi TaxID=585013 RepID=A0ABR3G1S2_9AGAR